MIRSSTRGIFLAIVILFSVSLILIPSNGYAEEIDVKSIGLDKTTVISFTNDTGEDVKTFRIWLSENVNFKSFKTEKGWIGEKNAQGVIIFTSSEPIKTGESVKFGVKTDKSNPVINWKGLDQANTTIDTGVVISTKIIKVNQNPEINLDKNGEIFSESTFRIIPDKPNSGSTIRVTGETFGASQMFDFYIDTKKIGSFVTDEDGFFITTMKIPSSIKTEDRVNFIVKNNQGEEKVLSLRLGNNDNRITELKEIKISVNGIKNIVHRGDILEISGTATPGKSIIAEISDPERVVINSRTAKVDGTGNWSLLKPINVPYDASFGKYSITISDGRNHILKNWIIETDKTIMINPTQIMFEAGELIKFNGTALPNKTLELILEDNHGNEVTSDIIEVDKTGFIEFEYQSKENDDNEGTWTLIATQIGNTEFVYVGYDEMPEIPVKIKFNKTNYKSSETAIISLIGIPSDTMKMTIISPTGGVKGGDIPITLQEDGRGTYELNLSGFSSGIYTAVTKVENSQSSERFSVGLQIGSGDIKAKLTKIEYQPGDNILLLGNTNSNSLLTAILSDPSGKEIKIIEIPTDAKGTFTEDGFRIPTTGALGTWKIKINSGSNLEVITFDVISTMTEGIL
nr:biofilm-associated protein [Nitrosopumilus sp.]